jgi:hypothetical protein
MLAVRLTVRLLLLATVMAVCIVTMIPVTFVYYGLGMDPNAASGVVLKVLIMPGYAAAAIVTKIQPYIGQVDHNYSFWIGSFVWWWLISLVLIITIIIVDKKT